MIISRLDFIGISAVWMLAGGLVAAGIFVWRRDNKLAELRGIIGRLVDDRARLVAALEQLPPADVDAGTPIYDAMMRPARLEAAHRAAGPADQLPTGDGWETAAERYERLERQLDDLRPRVLAELRGAYFTTGAELAASELAVDDYLAAGNLAVPDWLPDYPTHQLEPVR